VFVCDDIENWKKKLKFYKKKENFRLATYGIEITEKEAETEPPIQFRIILLEVYRGIPQTYFLDESIFDHKWDCSFEGIVGQTKLKIFWVLN
jgi:hypothetical protein